MKEIEFYRTESDQCPVEEYLDTLTPEQAQKVTWTLNLIEELDRVPKKYFKKMEGTKDIWEVRVQLGNNIFRLLGFCPRGNLLVLTHGFTKKTERISKTEIETAESRKKDYLSRRQTHERFTKIHQK